MPRRARAEGSWIGAEGGITDPVNELVANIETVLLNWISDMGSGAFDNGFNGFANFMKRFVIPPSLLAKEEEEEIDMNIPAK